MQVNWRKDSVPVKTTGNILVQKCTEIINLLTDENGTDQSRLGESVIIRQRRKAAYHCLDPWTAETSGKWRGGRKSPCQATAIKNTEERQTVSEVASAKPLPFLGGVDGSRCSAVAHRWMRSKKDVSACTVIFR